MPDRFFIRTIALLFWSLMGLAVVVPHVQAQAQLQFPQTVEDIWVLQNPEIPSFHWGISFSDTGITRGQYSEGYLFGHLDDSHQDILRKGFLVVIPNFNLPQASNKPVTYFYLYELTPEALVNPNTPTDPNSELELVYMPDIKKLFIWLPDGPLEFPDVIEPNELLYSVFFSYHRFLEHTGKIKNG